MNQATAGPLHLRLESAGPRRPTELLAGRGLRDRLPELLARHAPAAAYVIIADHTVAPLYGEPLVASLRAGGPADLLTFPAGEASKTPAVWAALVQAVGALGLGRDGCVVAVGGGVTGDLAGFVAASYARGVPLVQVPTSLLAMIDASIGGKTGVDLRAGKNLAGAFHDPLLVVADPDVLATLPPRELRTGLAEAVKHGAIADVDYFDWLQERAEAVLDLEPDAVDPVVRGSIRIKTDVVRRDAREAGERAILNFGHTIGHAVERITDYRVPHGEAVAVGMVAEAALGEAIGVTRGGTADRVRAALQALGLPTGLPAGVDARSLVTATQTDKKGRAGRVRYALLESVGSPARAQGGAWTHPVEEAAVQRTLDALWRGTDRAVQV